MITDAFLKSMNDPIPEDTMKKLSAYMISMSSDKAATVASCATYLKSNNTMQALLHVQYALNGDILLRSNETDDLDCEFQKMLGEDSDAKENEDKK